MIINWYKGQRKAKIIDMVNVEAIPLTPIDYPTFNNEITTSIIQNKAIAATGASIKNECV